MLSTPAYPDELGEPNKSLFQQHLNSRQTERVLYAALCLGIIKSGRTSFLLSGPILEGVLKKLKEEGFSKRGTLNGNEFKHFMIKLRSTKHCTEIKRGVGNKASVFQISESYASDLGVIQSPEERTKQLSDVVDFYNSDTLELSSSNTSDYCTTQTSSESSELLNVNESNSLILINNKSDAPSFAPEHRLLKECLGLRPNPYQLKFLKSIEHHMSQKGILSEKQKEHLLSIKSQLDSADNRSDLNGAPQKSYYEFKVIDERKGRVDLHFEGDTLENFIKSVPLIKHEKLIGFNFSEGFYKLEKASITVFSYQKEFRFSLQITVRKYSNFSTYLKKLRPKPLNEIESVTEILSNIKKGNDHIQNGEFKISTAESVIKGASNEFSKEFVGLYCKIIKGEDIKSKL